MGLQNRGLIGQALEARDAGVAGGNFGTCYNHAACSATPTNDMAVVRSTNSSLGFITTAVNLLTK
ncbi:hypothetical protein [Nostoc sp.]|uniref:hypothetical protein n=1 Tax=Nostoc sp. TaxID=1180 RepID=UPI002FFC90C2